MRPASDAYLAFYGEQVEAAFFPQMIDARRLVVRLPDRLGIDPTYVSRIERGKRGARWYTVMRFLRALDMKLSDLTAEVEKRDSSSKRGRQPPAIDSRRLFLAGA
jgi:transcriptional regulator with XRE-family HTH domain